MDKLLNLTMDELKMLCRESGLPGRVASQLYNWFYSKFVLSFDKMTDISKEIRSYLKTNFTAADLRLEGAISDISGEAVKFLLETGDGIYIESVLIFKDDIYTEDDTSKITLCVSSQAGCPLGCSFCATGLTGYKRDLEPGEIISQVLLAEVYILNTSSILPGQKTGRNISNIVFMGMGEPLLNYDKVIKSIHILNYDKGYNMGGRHFTLSTSGIIPGIERLEEEKEQIRLSVSLHTADQDKRASIMPVSAKYPLAGLLKALRHYQEKTGRRITFEYVLMEGFNDSEADVILLKDFLAGIKYNLNIIPYNPVEGLPFQQPSSLTIREFSSKLKKLKIPYVYRKSKGLGIKAACGQLGLLSNQYCKP